MKRIATRGSIGALTGGFLGVILKQSTDSNSPNAALTGTNIKFDFSYSSETGFKYHITCQFDKNSSWGRVKTDYILSHEQGHFDIAEIYTRKLCKAFREYKPDVEGK